jgi:predicted amidohydrolase
MQNLKITIIQPDIVWENPAANLAKYAAMISTVENPDLIVLPEMFTTGFSMKPEMLKEPMDGNAVNWLKKTAIEKNTAIVGSLIIEERSKIFNRAVWVFPDGNILHYDKRHLYTMGQEHLHYSRGAEKLIVEYKGWRICPLICYDLRFPVWSRNAENYDLLIYMANWPSPRHHVWKLLLAARAVENQCFCLGVNRTGNDGAGLKYLGDSGLVDSKGFTSFIGEKESMHTFGISYAELQNFRESFPLLEDRDNWELSV